MAAPRIWVLASRGTFVQGFALKLLVTHAAFAEEVLDDTQLAALVRTGRLRRRGRLGRRHLAAAGNPAFPATAAFLATGFLATAVRAAAVGVG